MGSDCPSRVALVGVFRRKQDKPLLEAARLIGRAQALRDTGHFREAADIFAELVRRFDAWPERRDEALPRSLSALGYTLGNAVISLAQSEPTIGQQFSNTNVAGSTTLNAPLSLPPEY